MGRAFYRNPRIFVDFRVNNTANLAKSGNHNELEYYNSALEHINALLKVAIKCNEVVYDKVQVTQPLPGLWSVGLGLFGMRKVF